MSTSHGATGTSARHERFPFTSHVLHEPQGPGQVEGELGAGGAEQLLFVVSVSSIVTMLSSLKRRFLNE